MRKYYLLSSLFIFLLPFLVFSQHMEQQVSNFSSRMVNPVTVEVKNNGKDITFMAENESYYPYELEIQFTKFINLTPVMDNYKKVIGHGRTSLFTVSALDPKDYHDYAYQMRYRIGYTNKRADTNYMYTIPLKDGKAIQLSNYGGDNATVFYRNMFMLNSGDTVINMRKGVVTHVISSGEKLDGLVQASSVEVLHKDGTVATYAVPDEDNVLVLPGQEVYPLQPLMVVKNANKLTIHLYEINNLSVKPVSFLFESENSKDDTLNGKIIQHSLDNAEQELTSREKKKMDKHELF